MEVHIKDNKHVIITETKTCHFHLPKNVYKNLKHEIDSIIKHNEFLAEHTMRTRLLIISQLFFKYKHGTDINKHEKTVKQNKVHENMKIDENIVAKAAIDFWVAGDKDMTQKTIAFRNNAPFGSCI